MKIRISSRLWHYPFWINPAMIVGALWCFAWVMWWVFYSDRTHAGAPISESPLLLSSAPFEQYHQIERDVKIKDYFNYIDQVARRYDSLRFYPIDEYLLVRSNPWLIDTLASTDYYLRKDRGEFVPDQKELVVLYQGDLLRVPDSAMVCALQDEFANTLIDVNIPAYRLQVEVYDEVVYEMPVRVGRNQRKYLAMAEGVVDLRTQPGYGKIIQINKDADYINPSNNHPYFQTRRDDGHYTRLPRIPWLEPELNGQRWGQWIHPTTNIETLGRAYSNGCIGIRESDAWRLYYYAPVGARIHVRYDLVDRDRYGNRVVYRDIYGWGRPGA